MHTALHLFERPEFIIVFDIIILGGSFKIYYPLLLYFLGFETEGKDTLFSEFGASHE